MIRDGEKDWPPDLAMFGTLAVLWAIVLMVRVLSILHGHRAPFEDVLLGVKFYGSAARLTMTMQAATIAAFGLAILARKRWGVVLALIYMLQVLAGHLIFITLNFSVEYQRVHVRVAVIELPGMLLIALYLWHRAKRGPLMIVSSIESSASRTPMADAAIPRYRVMIGDNFHYHELGDYDDGGTYNTLDKAMAACRNIVDRSLQDQYEQMLKFEPSDRSAEALYKRYSSFGDEAFIRVIDGVDDKAKFSSWTYAKQRCDEICSASRKLSPS